MKSKHNGNLKRKERTLLLQTYGSRYKKPYIKQFSCIYCGAPSTEKDHVPNLTDAELFADLTQPNRPIHVLVPCCGDCNRILSNGPYYLTERAKKVYEVLTKRYEDKYALWSKEELSEMSPQFQKQILARKHKQHELLLRVHYAEKASHNLDWVYDEI